MARTNTTRSTATNPKVAAALAATATLEQQAAPAKPARVRKTAVKTEAEVATIAAAMQDAAPAAAVTVRKAGKGAVAVVIDPSAGSKALAPHTVGEEGSALPVVGRGAAARKEATQAPGEVTVVKADGTTSTAKATRAKAKPTASALPLPAVFADEHRHTCIAVSEGRKYVHLIPMDAGGIAVTKLSKDKFSAQFGKHMGDYPVGKAARTFLAGCMVVTPQARELLETLAKAEADKPLAQGTLVALMSRGDEAADIDTIAHDTLATATGPASSTAPAKQKAAPGKKAAGDKAPKAPKAPRAAAAWAMGDKVLAKGAVDYAGKVREGTFRYALMEAIVKAAGKKASEVLGVQVMDGKPGVAKVDVEFAVKQGYVSVK